MAAIFARGRWVLTLPGCRSLKAKRSVVRSLRDRVRARFPVSAAETDFQDDPGRAEISVALVTSDAPLADSILQKIDALVASDPRLYVVEREARVL
jgi:uncharacterized protein YlxP (DUF503 family)